MNGILTVLMEYFAEMENAAKTAKEKEKNIATYEYYYKAEEAAKKAKEHSKDKKDELEVLLRVLEKKVG